MSRSSIKLSLPGVEVDCTTKTSAPRTLSLISTKISPSLKRRMSARPRVAPRCAQIASARPMLAFPAKTWIEFIDVGSLSAQLLLVFVRRDQVVGDCAGRTRTFECRNQNPVPYQLGDRPS